MGGGTHVVVLAGITGVYFLAGKLGLSLAVVNDSASAVWPPAGIALAALLLFGMRMWPAIAAGAFLVNVTTNGQLAPSLAIAAGNTLEGVTAAWLVMRFAHGRDAFTRTPDIVRFTLLAGLLSTMVAASVGTATLLLSNLATPDDAASVWVTWWLGDAVGTLVVTPLLLLGSRPVFREWTPARVAEGLTIAVAIVVVSTAVFGASAFGALRLPIETVTAPLLLWAAFRFGAWETAVGAMAISAIAIRGTLDGFGPFVRTSPNESLVLLQCFIGVMTIVMLAVAAEVAGRRQVEQEIRALNHELEQRVTTRTEELTRVHARLIEAQQVAQVGSWEWDVATNALWWSEEMCRIFGLPQAPTTYEDYMTRVHPSDRALTHEAVARASQSGAPFTFQHRILRADGAVRTLHAEGRIVLDADGQAMRMVGTGHDITERIAAEEQRAQLFIEQARRREAEQASHAKDQFLATLSHELRTPLNVAVGWAHMLRGADPVEGGVASHARPWDHRRSAAVETIYRNLQLLAQLVSDIMDASRIASGAFRIEAGEVELTTLIREAVETVRHVPQARSMTVEMRIPVEPVRVSGDARRLQQVVWNLLANAVKFGREDGRVTISLTYGPSSAEIIVEDDGPGIDESFLPHVFDEFRQADPTPSRTHGGLGLGLSIARNLVELHGGSITAANRSGGGAVFTVRLPVDLAMART
jgi:PAS domain S-box-containing protein